ncbi:MAG: LysR family transcriptional regulator [Sphingomonas sp.]|nr:MAG: LysR family transcriptional regulator [Sphingomonas sp.]
MGSLSKAATVLNRPQPVISRHINSLETECGCHLFYRTGRGVVLSEVGQAIQPRVQAMIAEFDQIMRDIKGQAGVPVGRVSVGLLPSIRIATELVHAATTQFPGIDLHLTEASGGQLAEQVAVGRIDLALVLREQGALLSTEEALLTLPMCVVGSAGDPVTSRRSVALSELSALPLIMAKPPNAVRMLVEQTARRAEVPLRFATQVDPPATQRQLVAAGFGYSITTRMSVRDDVAAGLLSAAAISDPPMDMVLVLVRSNQRPATLAIRKIARLLSDLIRHLPERHAGDEMPAYLPVEPSTGNSKATPE